MENAAKMPFYLPEWAGKIFFGFNACQRPLMRDQPKAVFVGCGKSEKWQTFSVTLRKVSIVIRAPTALNAIGFFCGIRFFSL